MKKSKRKFYKVLILVALMYNAVSVKGQNPLGKMTAFWQEYHEFGSLGVSGNKYMRPSCDNAAAMNVDKLKIPLL